MIIKKSCQSVGPMDQKFTLPLAVMVLAHVVALAFAVAPAAAQAESAADSTAQSNSENQAPSQPAVAKEAKSKSNVKSDSKSADGKSSEKSKGAKVDAVVIETSMGQIEVELDRAKAPISVENFLKYVDEKHYDGTVFHRVIKGFMIQGGGMTQSGTDLNQKKTQAPIKIESDNGLKNVRGTLAMARTSDPNSATSQFFINVVDNGFLDFTAKTPQGYGYAVFGKVTKGMDVVDKIRVVETGRLGPHSDVPKTPVTIVSVKRKQ